MKLENLNNVEALSDFLSGSQAILFEVASSKRERYQFIERVLCKTGYLTLKRGDKGIVRQFLLKVTGYSRAQLTRLLKQYALEGKLRFEPSKVNGFKCKYTPSDIRLLAKMDERYDCLSGGTTKKLCERAYTLFNDKRFVTLKDISVAQIYRFRGSKTYRNCNYTFTKTQPAKSKIGQRKKPFTDGQAGFIRIDTVHQGDLGKTKGVYHINAVDEETQFQVVMSVSAISERFLLPVLKTILATFPFVIKGFHSDNGSEYINQRVAKLLNKLHIELTKSRARKSNDNALAESKNASVVRKLFGYHHIPRQYAGCLNEFHQTYLIEYLNYHRPCYFGETIENPEGKQRRIYPYKNMMTPYEKLNSLPEDKRQLKTGVCFEKLDQFAFRISDNECKDQLNKAYQRLMQQILKEQQTDAG